MRTTARSQSRLNTKVQVVSQLMRGSQRPWLILFCLAIVLGACRSRPDIVGRSSEAQEWAESQRGDGEPSKDEGQRGWPHPVATPEVRPELPEQAPGPRRSTGHRPAAPLPARPTAVASSRKPILTGLGTGFAIDQRGTIVTAQHVIRGSTDVAVMFSGSDEVFPASVVRVSAATDVAVLKIEQPPPDFVALARTGSAHVGLPVFTMGFPDPELLGMEPKFTDGTISALSGLKTDAALLQISVPIQPGNSGGPLLNDRGEVVGVVISSAAALTFYGRTGALPQNVNYASKAENLRLLLAAEPRTRAPAKSRREAIERATRAVCIVGAFRTAPSKRH